MKIPKELQMCLQAQAQRGCYSWPKYDGRRRMFRGLSRSEYEAAWERHVCRWSVTNSEPPKTRVQKVMEDLEYFAGIPYEYEGDGLDDYNKFQRPTRNGVGYVAICPGESGNNYYVDDPVLVTILKRKYDAYWTARS